MLLHAAETALILVIVLGSAYHLLSLFCVVSFFRRKESVREPADSEYPPVSILKPMKGVDAGWRRNVDSFLAQEYPEYEILFGFNDPADEGIAAASAVAQRDPAQFKVIVDANRLGSNPKASTLDPLVREARYSLLLISDSDIRVDRQYLRSIVREYVLAGNAGTVTCLSKITRAVSTGAAMEMLTASADFIPSVMVARCLRGVSFGLGASMLLAKEQLAEIGGLAAYADFLAEDYQIGNVLSRRGYTNVLSRYVVENVVGKMSLRDYVVHQLRWARTYRACSPAGFTAYGISHVFLFSLCYVAVSGAASVSLLLAGGVLALRFALFLSVALLSPRRCAWGRWLWLLPLKELLSTGIWGWCFMGSRLHWRGNRYRLLKGGLMKKDNRGFTLRVGNLRQVLNSRLYSRREDG